MVVDEFAQLIEDIRARRGAGSVGGIILPTPAGFDQVRAADLAAAHCSLHQLGDRWRDISETQAQALIQRFLHKDLAYECAAMSQDSAAALALEFMKFTRPPRVCFTNGLWPSDWLSGTPGQTAVPSGRHGGWNPISNATFDAGIVSIDSEWVAMLWVEDED